jgi:hypothetical protein
MTMIVFSRKLPLLVLNAGVCIVFGGCFTREEPFYEESQIVQDSRLPGAYENVMMGPPEQKDEASWSITPSNDEGGKYEVLVREHDVRVELLATLFRVGTNLFLDLYPLTDSGVSIPGDVPTVSQVLRGAMYEPLHVVWKVELSGDAISYSFPFRRGEMAALEKAPELKRTAKGGRVFIPGSAKDAQNYLLKFKDDPAVFDYKGRLVKKKGDTQRSGPANRSQPVASDTNRTSAAAGSVR